MKKRIIALILLVCFSSAIFARGDVVIDETILEPKDPILGTVIAIGPGFLAHGWGQFYAEDYRTGMLLFGIEILSIIAISVGYIEYANPSAFGYISGSTTDAEKTGVVTMAIGALFFVGSWVADIALAGRAAEQYNVEHNLEFKLQEESGIMTPGLMLSFNY